MILESYTIESAVIEITYIDDSTEDFTLEAPNGNFIFGGERIVIRGDYRDKNKVLRKGQFKYHLFWEYEYETHEMDLRKLLIAEKITLKAPPNFYGGSENYQSYEVRLQNTQAVKDYYQGVISATQTEDEMPSGGVTLEFKTITPMDWVAYLAVPWFQDEIQIQPNPPANFDVELVEGGGYALSFDGVDDYVDFGDIIDIGDSDKTYEIQFKPTDLDTRGALFAKGDASNDDDRLNIVARADAGDFNIIFPYISGEQPDYTFTEENTLFALIIDRDNDELKVVVDSTVLATRDISSVPNVDSAFRLTMGARTDNSSLDVFTNFFTGELKKFRVWNSVRTLSELSNNKDILLNGDEAGLEAAFEMTEGEGSVLNDVSPNEYTGQINGANWVEVEGGEDINGIFTWDAVPEVDGYNLYINKDGAGYVKENAALITGTEFTINSMPEGSYDAYVVAFANGLESDPSNVVSFVIS